MLRFASRLPYIPRRLWAGGYNYQSNLFAALEPPLPRRNYAGAVRRDDDDAADLAALARIPAWKSCDRAPLTAPPVLLARWRWGSIARRSEFAGQAHRRRLRNRAFLRLASAFSSAGMVSRFSASTACRSSFRRPRDGGAISAFRVQIASGRSIMLSSESALRDFRKFYPDLPTNLGGPLRDPARRPS